MTNRRILRHRVPTAAGYAEIVVLGESDNLTLLDRTETIRIRELLPAAPDAP